MDNLDGYVEYLKETCDEDTGSISVDKVHVPVKNFYCNLVGKRLAHIPYLSICRIQTIVSLDLSYNDITYIPPELVDGLPHVKEFYIGHNRVKALPSNIGGWAKLVTIYAQYNQIQNVPDMSALVKLERLNLAENPLIKIWKLGFGDTWDLDAIEKAAIFARGFYRSTGLTEAEIMKQGNTFLGDSKPETMSQSGLSTVQVTSGSSTSTVASGLRLEDIPEYEEGTPEPSSPQ